MRYSRQELFERIGKEGQKKLSDSKIAVVGAGAIGSVCSELLARSGAGELNIIDRDLVELTNLQRQTLFNEDDIGKSKAIQAKEHLKKINSEIKINAFPNDLNYENIYELVGKTDLILDCTDNFETRFLINDYSVKENIPWIYASAIKDEGYVLLIKPKKFCFRCVFNNAKNFETCDTVGVINTITNSIASIQVNEAIKYLINKDYDGKLIKFNIWENSLRNFKVSKKNKCITCSGKFEFLDGKKVGNTIKLCGSGNFQIKGNIDLNMIKSRLGNFDGFSDLGYCLRFNNISMFKDRALIKAINEEEAKSLYSRYIGN